MKLLAWCLVKWFAIWVVFVAIFMMTVVKLNEPGYLGFAWLGGLVVFIVWGFCQAVRDVKRILNSVYSTQ